jgi:hypothetical protein
VVSVSDSQISFECRPWSDLSGLIENWAALALRADMPNIFFDPVFAVPAARALGVEDRLQAALFWRNARPDDPTERQLVGFAPLIHNRRWLVPPTNLEVWTHPYGPSSLPLADPEFADEMGRALVTGLAATADMPRIMVLPKLVIDSSFAAGLLGAGAPLFVHDGFQKPMVALDLDGDAYIAHAIRSNRRNRMKRQRKQLSKMDALEFRMLGPGDDLDGACKRFLALEGAGWKGRSGTALTEDVEGLALFDGVTASCMAAGRLRVAELTLGDHPLASLIILCSERRCWFWKITFDERQAAHSPGRLLLVDAVTALLNETPGMVIDSCAGVADHFSGNVLREREAVGTVLLTTRPSPNIIFRAANMLERARASARSLKQRLGS